RGALMLVDAQLLGQADEGRHLVRLDVRPEPVGAAGQADHRVEVAPDERAEQDERRAQEGRGVVDAIARVHRRGAPRAARPGSGQGFSGGSRAITADVMARMPVCRAGGASGRNRGEWSVGSVSPLVRASATRSGGITPRRNMNVGTPPWPNRPKS